MARPRETREERSERLTGERLRLGRERRGVTPHLIETPRQRSERLAAEEREERLRFAAYLLIGIALLLFWGAVAWAVLL